jgi:hypothetical protein
MALTTYSDLLSAVATWLARSDLTAQIPDFVVMFEAAFNRKVRVRRMETSVTLTPSGAGQVTLPADFLEMRRVTWLGDPRLSIEYVTPEYLQMYNSAQAEGYPQVYTIEGGTLQLAPISTTDVELAYYGKVPALSASTNWLFAQHPDLYLAGALFEAFSFIQDIQKAMAWKARHDEIIGDILALDQAGKFPAAMRPMGVPTP